MRAAGTRREGREESNGRNTKRTSLAVNQHAEGEDEAATAGQGRTPVTSAWISETCKPSDDEAVMSGSKPDKPLVVDHATFQCVVTRSGNTPSVSEFEGRE